MLVQTRTWHMENVGVRLGGGHSLPLDLGFQMKDDPLRQPCPNLQNILFTTPPTLRKENDLHVWCVLRKDLKCMSQFFLFSTFTLLLPTENTYSHLTGIRKLRVDHFGQLYCQALPILGCVSLPILVINVHKFMCLYVKYTFSSQSFLVIKLIFWPRLSRLREEKGSLFNINPIQS